MGKIKPPMFWSRALRSNEVRMLATSCDVFSNPDIHVEQSQVQDVQLTTDNYEECITGKSLFFEFYVLTILKI